MSSTRIRWTSRAVVTGTAALLLAAAPFAGGCSHRGSSSGPSMGTLDVSLTDAAGDFQEVVVTFDRLDVKTSSSDGFVHLALNTSVGAGGAVVDRDVARGRLTLDLVKLSGGTTLQLALGSVPAGRVEQIRLHVVEDRVMGERTPWVLEAGASTRAFVKIPSGYQTGIKIVPRNVEVTAGGLTAITLDFDAQRSVVALGGMEAGGPNRGFDFILKPVIFVKSAERLEAPATTIVTGLNFPTGTGYLAGDATLTADDRIAVSNGGTRSSGAGSNASTVLTVDPSRYAAHAPIDATATDGTVARASVAAPPTDLAVSEATRARGAFEVTAGDTLYHFLAAGGLASTGETVGGQLDAVAVASLSGRPIYFVGRGAEVVIVDAAVPTPTPLAIDGLVRVTGMAFMPGPSADAFGTLVITDRGADPADPADDQVVSASLSVTGGVVAVAGPVTRRTLATLDFLNEPVGVAVNAAGNVYVADRGNGFIHELRLDLAPVRVFDTGLGPDSLNGLAVARASALAGFETSAEVLLAPNTMGRDDPAADDPLDATATAVSTIEVIVAPSP